jgi:Protein of unknown function (DUF1425)
MTSPVRATATALIIAFTFALLPGAGCKTDTAPSPGVGDPYPPPGNDPQISVLSPELRRWLGFQPAIIVRDPHKPMSVEVPVRNSTYNAYNIDYRFLFYNDSGATVEPTMGWTFARMEPKEIVRLKGKALSTDAKSYRLEVQWAR